MRPMVPMLVSLFNTAGRPSIVSITLENLITESDNITLNTAVQSLSWDFTKDSRETYEVIVDQNNLEVGIHHKRTLILTSKFIPEPHFFHCQQLN
jgi:hypothetical protein